MASNDLDNTLGAAFLGELMELDLCDGTEG